jgi:hypothetical protein
MMPIKPRHYPRRAGPRINVISTRKTAAFLVPRAARPAIDDP